jgi:hypothetical protein
MTLLKSLLIGASALFFAGCSTYFPQHKTYDKDIVFIKGKPYLIPHGALFNTTPINEDVTVNDHHIYGKTDCRKGDVTWVSPKTAKELKETYRIDGADAFSYAYGEAIRTRRMGCARPLTQSEYDYYKTEYGL